MRKSTFQRILDKIPELNFQQRETLVDVATHLDERQQVFDMAERAFAEDSHCPHCQSRNIGTKGHDRSGLIRYVCRDCRKTFNALHETPLFGMHRTDRWLSNCREMIQGNSIRTTAGNIGVSPSCSFRMRHRTLMHVHTQEDEKLGGIVEIHEMFFPYSQKGQRKIIKPRPGNVDMLDPESEAFKELISVVTCVDRSNRERDFIGGFGQVCAEYLDFELHSVIESGTIVVTDMTRSFCSFVLKEGVRHVRLDALKQEPVKNVMHLQNVYRYESNFMAWMHRFRGVATKYLDHYLGWFHELFAKKVGTPELFMAISLQR